MLYYFLVDTNILFPQWSKGPKISISSHKEGSEGIEVISKYWIL